MEKEKVDVLIVVDMQNDFVTGSLGTPEAQAKPVLQAFRAQKRAMSVTSTGEPRYETLMTTI